MKPAKINFMKRLGQLLIELDWTAAELADKSDISATTLSRWNHTEELPTDKSIKKICRAAGCSFDWLKEGHGEMFSKNNGTVLLGRTNISGGINTTGRNVNQVSGGMTVDNRKTGYNPEIQALVNYLEKYDTDGSIIQQILSPEIQTFLNYLRKYDKDGSFLRRITIEIMQFADQQK